MRCAVDGAKISLTSLIYTSERRYYGGKAEFEPGWFCSGTLGMRRPNDEDQTMKFNDEDQCMNITSNDDKDRDDDGGGGTGVVTQTRTKTKKPSMYRVLMMNDDYTPMEFVVHVLERFFHKNAEEATVIMLHVHQKGVGICGVFPYDIAETKVVQTTDYARRNQHPLQCTMEKE
jgi:ATP-dependent Clp protease adaptor protein ClpS